MGTDLYVAIVIGVLVSLVYVERSGMLPAGLVVPGYLALAFGRIGLVFLTFAIAFATYLFVGRALTRWITLYGRRTYAAMVMVGVILQLAVAAVLPTLPFAIAELRGIGVITPGLIANAIDRQGVAPTLVTTLALAGVTFLLLQGYLVVGAVTDAHAVVVP
jgi:gamma-polyglutamate biosynthesis protein CapC